MARRRYCSANLCPPRLQQLARRVVACSPYRNRCEHLTWKLTGADAAIREAVCASSSTRLCELTYSGVNGMRPARKSQWLQSSCPSATRPGSEARGWTRIGRGSPPNCWLWSRSCGHSTPFYPAITTAHAHAQQSGSDQGCGVAGDRGYLVASPLFREAPSGVACALRVFGRSQRVMIVQYAVECFRLFHHSSAQGLPSDCLMENK